MEKIITKKIFYKKKRGGDPRVLKIFVKKKKNFFKINLDFENFFREAPLIAKNSYGIPMDFKHIAVSSRVPRSATLL